MGKDARNWVTSVLLSVVALPGLAAAAEPPTEPVLRIESEMHTANIRRIATDAAGRYVVTGSWDKTVRVWDLASGRLLRILRPPIGVGHDGKIYSVAMSPDGSIVACGGWTGYDWDKSHSVYLFDRATGRLLRRITGLSDGIGRLAWSSDGRLLATALLGRGGIRVFRVQDGVQIGSDTAYGDNTYGIEFDRGGGKLVSASDDGFLRLYRVSESGLALVVKQAAPGGKQPFTVRFSPDGSKVAVGFDDSWNVDVLSGDTLSHLYSADTQGIKDGDLSKVAWSADGRVLYAGGRYQVRDANKEWFQMIRAWAQEGRGAATELPAAHNTIVDIIALRTGGIVYGAQDPRFGVFDATGRKILEQGPTIADFRNNADGFRVSRNGAAVLFGFEIRGKTPARFDLSERRLVLEPADDPSLIAPVTQAPGLDVKDWRGSLRPTLNGQPLKLEAYEQARSLAVAPDQQSFVLGTEWNMRRFDRQGKQLWSVAMPGTTWAVNISGDGKVVVAALGDGTIRWFRLSDGVELLALFPHTDRRRWVLWSSSGYYDTSAGGEELVGWHLNRGKETAADFYPASRFRATFYRPDVIAKVLETLDEQAGLRLANEGAGRATTRAVEIAQTLPPVVEILSPADSTAVSTSEVRVTFRVRTAGDAPLLALKSRVNGQTVTLRSITEARGGEAREVAIPVPPQDSDIMMFAENRHGVSVPAVLHVTWRGTTPGAAGAAEFAIKPKLYVLAVGVGRYQSAELKLQYPAKDARDFAQALMLQKGRLYRDVEMKVLTDAQATRDEVVDGLDWLQRQVTAKDVAMLFLAGHGVNDPTGIFYYLPVNADVERLKRTGVPFSDIRNTLSALPGKALFFVDTCFSGNIMGTRRAAPTDITAVVNELASAENGVVVFASSTGRQYSLESSEWQNGAFTKALVEGLTGRADLGKTGKITHKMLDYFVSERVKELTRGKQTPVNPAPRGVPDFPIALVGK